jgi:hypothetical protein
MAKVSFNISPAPSITNDLIAVLYKTTAPGAEIARILDDSDHSSPQNFQFSDLDPGTYIVVIHESPDGSTLGNIRHDFWVDAVTNQLLLERKFYRVAGGDTYDPAVDTTKIIDPYFVGKNITGIFQQGNRYLRADKSEWSVNEDGEIVFGLDSVGGQQIKNWENAVWAVEITYAQEATGVGAQQYGDMVLITEDITINSTHYNRTIYARSVANKLIVTVPALASIPENKGFTLIHDGGAAINVILQLQPGDVVRFFGDSYNDIILGIGEGIRCLKKTVSGTPYLWVEPLNNQWARVGEIIHGRELLPNSVILNADEYDLSIYVRLGRLVAGLPGDQIVDYATFDTTATIDGEEVYTKRGFFAMDYVNNKCKVPDLQNQALRFLKAGADSSRVDQKSGGYQHHKVGPHTQEVPIPANKTRQNQEGTGFIVGGAGGGEEPGPLSSLSASSPAGSTETVMRNIGFLPLLLI